MTNEELERVALKTLFMRYKSIISNNEEILLTMKLPEKCEFTHLNNLVNEAINNLEKYPTDKMHRWLGFIQGVLCVTGLISVDEEREFSRPLLHSYHSDKPKSF